MGRNKKMAEAIAVYLSSSGITSIYGPTDADKVAANVLYHSGGLDQTFTQGSTTILSDDDSNDDYVWNLLGYAGETEASTSGFLPSTVIHRYIPYAGEATVNLTDSSSVLLYSKDGPQARFNQYFLPAANQISGTGSLVFSSAITGAAAGFTKLKIYVAGAFPTGSTGSKLTIVSGSTPIITYTSASLFDSIDTTASFRSTFINGISSSLPSASDMIGITLPVGYAGLTTSASYTITITGSLTPTASGNNLYILSASANPGFVTGTFLHNTIAQGINGSQVSSASGLTSSIGSGFQTLANYISASSVSTGVDLYAKYNGGTAYSIAVSGSNNKIKKTSGINYFQFEPYFVTASFTTASLGTAASAVTITYSSSATTATLNSWAPGVIVYITGSN